jgi:hypothetical protein
VGAELARGGFHYRGLRHAQARGRAEVLRYGPSWVRWSSATPWISHTLRWLPHDPLGGERRYGKGRRKRTSDIAVVSGKELILLEVNARRVTANAVATGEVAEALGEVSPTSWS